MARSNKRAFVTISNREVYDKVESIGEKLDTAIEHFEESNRILAAHLIESKASFTEQEKRITGLESWRDKSMAFIGGIAFVFSLAGIFIGKMIDSLLKGR